MISDLFHIALAWILYGILHSWLASAWLKRAIAARWPSTMRAYRLAYNLFAILLLVPPLWLTYAYPGPTILAWPAWLAWPAALASVAGYLWSMKWYDGMDFLGLRNLAGAEARESFILSPMHRYVRHPWYSLGLLFLWTRDLNAGWLVAVIAITLYLVIGARLEEEKLIATYGDAYKLYRKRVPGLIPWPGKRLDAAEVEALLTLAARQV